MVQNCIRALCALPWAVRSLIVLLLLALFAPARSHSGELLLGAEFHVTTAPPDMVRPYLSIVPTTVYSDGKVLHAWLQWRGGDRNIPWHTYHVETALQLWHAQNLAPSSAKTLSMTAKNAEVIGAAAAGGVFLVVWNSWEDAQHSIIHGARVNARNERIDPVQFRISEIEANAFWPVVAGGAASFLVSWSDSRADLGDVYARVVSPTGVGPVGPSFPVGAGPGAQLAPAIAAGGGGYLVAWASDHGETTFVHGARVTADGVLLDTTPLVLGATEPGQEIVGPSVAWDGTNYFSAWLRRGPLNRNAQLTYEGRVIAPDGAIGPLARLEGLPVEAALPLFPPMLEWTGREMLLSLETTANYVVQRPSSNLVGRLEMKDGAYQLKETLSLESHPRLAEVTAGPDGQALFTWTTNVSEPFPAVEVRAQRYFPEQPPLEIEGSHTEGAVIVLHWLADPGQRYVIEGRAALTAGSWSPASPVITTESVTMRTVIDRASAMSFYRIRQLNPQ